MPTIDTPQPLTLINFSHPFTLEQVKQTQALAGVTEIRLFERMAKFDDSQHFALQARWLVEEIPLAPAEWQATPLLVNLPSFNYIAALVLAELHGRTGYFPSIVRLRQGTGASPAWEVVEILNLQTVRDAARSLR
jgi:hypothetical protein